MEGFFFVVIIQILKSESSIGQKNTTSISIFVYPGLCVGTPESIHSILKFLLCQFARCFMDNQTKVSLARYIGNIEIKRGLSAVGTVYR